MFDRMDRIAAIVAIVVLPIILYGVADAQLPAPKHRAVRSGDVHRTIPTTSIGPDPTAPITLFVATDIDNLVLSDKLPYARPSFEFVALFVGSEKPVCLTTRTGGTCLCTERCQPVMLHQTKAGQWAIIPIRIDTAPGHPNGRHTFEVARRFGQQSDPIVAVTDLATLPRMTACEGFGDCE